MSVHRVARCRSLYRLGLCVALLCSIAAPSIADINAEPPTQAKRVKGFERIVSVNLCIDRLLLQLLPLERITGLSNLSLRPDYSGFYGHIPAAKIHYGQVEELVYMQADLILAGQYGAVQTVATLRQLGFVVEVMPLPQTLAEGRDFVLTIGRLVGAEAEAAAYWARQEQLLEQARARVAQSDQRRTLLYAPNGMTIGEGTLEHIILTHIGLTNVAAESGLQGWQSISLEDLLVLNADRILLTGTSSHFSMAQEVLSHPVLRNRVAATNMAEGLSVCPALHAGELAMAMAP